MYIKDGVKIHVRQTKSLFGKGENDKRLTVRPTKEQMKEYGIQHYKGKQYRYIRFLCSKTEKKKLIKECLVDLNLPNPKDDDLSWTIKNLDTGKWEKTNKPPYKTDIDQKTKDILGIEKKTEDEFVRRCDVCGKEMREGFLIDDCEYYCSEECLHKKYTEEEYQEMYRQDYAYWTIWD